ncbi:PLP-dependent transferase [Sanghuangporus baumii]|uniref:PLP-dependent transferase n=1 Tax=Sanghuangporus baumii TaxID=108892 RepID=A0A9Q5HSP1_SANBA|nr:PLP-dependent transferase [Sanghuangporus baumii]
MLDCGLSETHIAFIQGSYGSLPLPVLTACEKMTREIEANPDRFMRSTYIPILRDVHARVAALVGADTDECVIVPNATHGVNTVLRNFALNEGDIVVINDVTYNAVSRTVQYLKDVNPQITQSIFALAFPTTPAIIIDAFRAHLKGLPRKSGCKIIAIIDSIASIPGALMPWKELVKICKEEDVMSVIDAAHSIGQELDINLKETDPDFWISNCHKWLYAKRGCAVLYVPKRNQHFIRSSIPTARNYVSPSDPPGGPEPPNFVEQFLYFRQWIGGEHRINEYCRNLALAGGKRLAEILGTRLLDENGEFTANMVNVGLPLTAEGTLDVLSRINAHLEEKNVNGKPYYHNGKWWVRCSTQIYNEMSDFEKLGKELAEVCKTIDD